MERDAYLALDDAALLAQCRSDAYKASGPGGQHRNKVSSAVRLRHGPTGLTVHGDDSRSQHENRRRALQRLRMHLACDVRQGFDPARVEAPAPVAACVFTARGGANAGGRRLRIGRKDHRFWRVAGFLLDALDACEGRLSEAAAVLGITTSNLASVLKQDRQLHAAAQRLRKSHGHGPIV